jgi:hypothetical protein
VEQVFTKMAIYAIILQLNRNNTLGMILMMKRENLLIFALTLVILIGASEGMTLANVHGHWGTQQEIINHAADVTALKEAFAARNITNVTIVDIDYTHGRLTDESPFKYVRPIGEAFMAINDSDVVVVAHSKGPLVTVLAVDEYNQSGKIAGMISLGGMWGGVPLGTYWLLNETMKNFNMSSEFVETTSPDSDFVRMVAATQTNYTIVEVHGGVEMAFGFGLTDYTGIFVPRPGSKVINHFWAFHPNMYQNKDVEKTIVEESMKMFAAHKAKAT